MSLKGNLEVLNLSDIFQSLSLNQHTGTLRVTDGKRKKEVYFTQGEIALLSSDKKLRLGEMLVNSGKVSEEDLRYALDLQKRSKKKLGEILVEEGFVSEEDVTDAVRTQIENEIYDLFLWKKADFEFLIDHCPEGMKEASQNLTKLHFNTNSLIMEALRRLDEWELIKKEIPNLKEVYKPANAIGDVLFEVDLPERVRAEARLVDGETTVEELAEITTLSEFELMKLLYELKTRGGIAPLAREELIGRADGAMRNGRHTKAAALYERLVELEPKNVTVRWHFAEALRAAGRHDEALTEYEQLVKRLEGKKDRAQLAAVYRAILEIDPMRKDLEERLKTLDVGSFSRKAVRIGVFVAVLALIGGGLLFLKRTGRLDGFSAAIVRMLGDEGTATPPAQAAEQSARELFDRAAEARRLGRLQEAHELLMKVIDLYPETGAAKAVSLPIQVSTRPPGKSVYINDTYRGESNNIFEYLPGAKELRIDIKEGNRDLLPESFVLDPRRFHDLTIDLFRRPVWSFETNGPIRAKPVVHGGVAYFPSLDGYLYGVRLDDGRQVLRLPLGPDPQSDPFGEAASSPALGGGDRLFVGTLDGLLLGFDLVRGVRQFGLRLSTEPLLAAPAVLADGQTIVVAGNDGAIRFASVRREAEVGRGLKTENRIVAAPAVLLGTAFVAGLDNRVRAIEVESQTVLWERELSGDIVAGPAVLRDLVIAGDTNGRVVAWRLLTGAVAWERAVGSAVVGLDAVGNLVFIALADGRLVALEAVQGLDVWAPVKLGSRPTPPAASARACYVGTADGQLHAIDPLRGQGIWIALLGQPVRATPTAVAGDRPGEGRILVGCEDGRLYCFRAE